ncbi:unnamed protein product [Nippostrongylus brasiliensis]|uniref:HEAT repeat domain-containing protein n=1 Tax=Nippostrongylus brasiliensis TaxID=27835 RepID=A0A0N4XGJ7_NIPBR|nr:unnamed protein product [Nippostrongylus brasiliensis]
MAIISPFRFFGTVEDQELEFHIINPVLPRLDVVLKSVYSNSLEFRWAKLLFIRAFAHSNGWVRLWALEKLLEVEPRFLAEDQDDKAAVADLGVLTNYFSRDDPALFDRFIGLESLNEVLRTGYEPTNVICELLDHQRDFQKDDFASLLWARAALLGKEDQLQKLIELELADRLLVVEEGVDAGLSSAIVYDVDALLTTLFFSPRGRENTYFRFSRVNRAFE